MAINRVYNSGLETGNKGEITSSHPSVIVTSAIKRTGTYSLRVSLNNSFDQWATFSIPATRQCRTGAFIYPNAGTGPYVDMTRLRNSGGTGLVQLQISGGSSNSLRLYVSGSLKATVSNAFTDASWMHIGIDAYIHASAGWVKVYKDGIEILSFSGNTGNSDIVDKIVGSTAGVGGTDYFYWDDIYIDDTTGEGAAAVCPILRFPLLRPTGAGNYTQWDPSAGNNYECVDEVPPSDADYVDTAVVDEFDSYAMGTYTLDTGEIFKALIPIVRAQRGDTTEEIALGTRCSSVDLVGSDQIPSASFGYLLERQTTKPGGGAWDQTSVDGVEVLIKSRGSY